MSCSSQPLLQHHRPANHHYQPPLIMDHSKSLDVIMEHGGPSTNNMPEHNALMDQYMSRLSAERLANMARISQMLKQKGAGGGVSGGGGYPSPMLHARSAQYQHHNCNNNLSMSSDSSLDSQQALPPPHLYVASTCHHNAIYDERGEDGGVSGGPAVDGDAGGVAGRMDVRPKTTLSSRHNPHQQNGYHSSNSLDDDLDTYGGGGVSRGVSTFNGHHQRQNQVEDSPFTKFSRHRVTVHALVHEGLGGPPPLRHRTPSPGVGSRGKESLVVGKAILKLTAYVNSGVLTVHVRSAQHLESQSSSSLCNSYVEVSLSPATGAERTYCTKCEKNTNHPQFNDRFAIELTGEDIRKRLLVSVWNVLSTGGSQELLGCMSFGVKNVAGGKRSIDGWYYLLKEDVGQRKHLQAIGRSKSLMREATGYSSSR